MLDKKKKRKEDLQKLLLECKSYDDFLRKAFSYLQKENKRLNRNIFKNLVKRSILHPPLLVNYISTTIKNPYVIKKYVFGKG